MGTVSVDGKRAPRSGALAVELAGKMHEGERVWPYRAGLADQLRLSRKREESMRLRTANPASGRKGGIAFLISNSVVLVLFARCGEVSAGEPRPNPRPSAFKLDLTVLKIVALSAVPRY